MMKMTVNNKGPRVEKVPRPIKWEAKYPQIEEDGDVSVDVWYMLHDGNSERKGVTGQVEFLYDREDFSSRLREFQDMDDFLKIQELGKLAKIRDEEFISLNLTLTDVFDSSTESDRKSIYGEVENYLFRNNECRARLKHLILLESLMTLAKKPKVFYSEEIQNLFT